MPIPNYSAFKGLANSAAILDVEVHNVPLTLQRYLRSGALGLTKGLTLLNCPALVHRSSWLLRFRGLQAMAAESSERGAMKADLSVDELLSMLKLSDAEKDEVVLAKEDRENLPAVKWMAAAKLLTSKEFSTASLFSTMRASWNPAREVSFRAIGKNLFVIQAFCLGDWKRIMEEGPWIFRGYALMLEEFDGSTTVPKVIPSRVLGWIQIHKIPHLF